ncbi:MAG: carboxy terminal-processing peptidase [Pseudomonadales bacterium]
MPLLRFVRNTLLASITLLVLQVPFAYSLAGYEIPESAQDSALEIISKLNRRHYQAPAIDDDFSEILLSRFTEYLDPSKMYLLQSDIDELSDLQYQLDDQMLQGDVSGGYRIYNRLHSRTEARMEKNIAGLDQMLENFDYSRDETIPLKSENIHWAKDEAEADDRWRKRIKNDVLNLRLAEKEPSEIGSTLAKRYEHQLKRLKQSTADDVFEYYMNAFAHLYDPHTSYFSPRQEENFKINMSRSLEGIGAVLTQDFEYTKVVRLVHAGPARKQGDLKSADRIVGVGQGQDGEIVNVIGWRLDEVVDLIRGDKDTWVQLEVISAKSKSSGETKLIKINRGKVELEDMLAWGEALDVFYDGAVHKVGYIKVPDFYVDFDAMGRGDPEFRSTTRDVAKIINELQTEGIEGIIVDLRDNGGGSLAEANSLTGLFIQGGPTVQIREANDKVIRQGKAQQSPYYAGPLVVMINRLSASASEIMAGALQDYQRGLVVGSTSFGKGTVQALIPLTEGQLKITQSKFYRISGVSTQSRGVSPDIHFPALYDPEDVGEDSLKGALAWDIIDPVRHPKYHNWGGIIDELTTRHSIRASEDPDFVYLSEEFSLIKENRNRELLSLNEDTRKQQREKNESLFLAIENRRRVSKGLEPLASLDEEEEDEEESILDDDEEEKESAQEDVMALEAATILLDTVTLQSAVKRVATQD